MGIEMLLENDMIETSKLSWACGDQKESTTAKVLLQFSLPERGDYTGRFSKRPDLQVS